MIDVVPKERVADVWPAARAALQPSLDIARERTAHDVLVALVTGAAELWHLHDPGDAWFVVEVTTMPAKRAAHMAFCGGRYPFHAGQEPALRARWVKYARAHGCTQLRLRGRRGWKRLLPDFTEHMMLTRELD